MLKNNTAERIVNLDQIGIKILPQNLNFLAPIAVGELVRVGRINDGGYILPKFILTETDFLLSMGISNDWSFEEDFLHSNPMIKIHAYDHTISEKKFKRQIAFSVMNLILRKIDLKNLLNDIKIYIAYKKFFKNSALHFPERIHNRLDQYYYVNLNRVFHRIKSRKKIFIKMDIEGDEYRVIEDIIKYQENIIGMVIEFHSTDSLRLVFIDSINKLSAIFSIVHIHANNYGGICSDGLAESLELTFIKKELCNSDRPEFKKDFPLVDLDHPCDKDKKDYGFSFRF